MVQYETNSVNREATSQHPQSQTSTVILRICGHGTRKNSPLCRRCRLGIHHTCWHKTVEWIYVSPVLAAEAVRLYTCPRSRVQTNSISDPTLRSLAERYLGVGETIFSMAQASVVNSEFFRKDSRR